MTRKYFVDLFGGSGFLLKASNHVVLRRCVLDTKFGPQHDVTAPWFLPESDRMFLLESVSQERFHLHDFTSRSLRQLSLSLRPSLVCFIVPACRGLWNTRVIRGCWTFRKSRLLQHSLTWPGP